MRRKSRKCHETSGWLMFNRIASSPTLNSPRARANCSTMRRRDALVSAGIALFIVPRTWRLLRQAVNVLLEGVPAHLDLTAIEEAMTQMVGVRRVHDLHVWTLTSGREAMSAHVVVQDMREHDRLLEALHAVLHTRFGIDHTTIQLETEPPPVLKIKAPRAL